jgi:hypothetical protein
MHDNFKIGTDFWARQVNGHYGPGGDPYEFTIVGETKTLWKIRRAGIPDHPPFTTKKDWSDYCPLPEDEAKRIIWLRANANRVGESVRLLVRKAFDGRVESDTYYQLKAIAELICAAPEPEGRSGK